ncbi:MAG: hypothetical protein EXR43_03270 [Dehalococcoidia bacterium]|nr:hypothetical protein [Dehalococcoidia bacterium]
MYGTVARLRLKPGVASEFSAVLDRINQRHSPGAVESYVYQMDRDPNELMLGVLFESKEAYFANANSPDQNAEYQRMRAMLAAEPEWNDGEIIAGIARAGVAPA